MASVTRIRRCRLCGDMALIPIWDMGNLFLSDFTPKIDPLAPRAPLRLVLCPKCQLLQLAETVDREDLYRRYWYESGLNERMRAELEDVLRTAARYAGLRGDETIIDIGCNDGSMLASFPNRLTKIGVDPSDIKPVDPNLNIVRDFWPTPQLDGVKAKVITSIACLYDQDDLEAFVGSIVDHLTDDGIWITQQMSAEGMYQFRSWDNVCHEHVTYLSDWTMAYLAKRFHLRLIGRELVAVNGGSVRYTYRKAFDSRKDDDAPRSIGAVKWTRWAEDCQANIKRTVRYLEQRVRWGKRIAGYGASTKGNTMLQMWGATPALIPYIADRNPRKRGTFTVGSWIPVVSEELMRSLNPDTLVILPWGFESTFRVREREYLARGGEFYLPLPTPKAGANADSAAS